MAEQSNQGPGLVPGARVGNLTIERELGRGGFAVVYLARDVILDRPVALKVLTLPQGSGVSEEQRRSFLAEARIVAGFQSPHVVTLHHVHEHEGSGWMIEMEYVGGGSLRDRLRAGTGLPVSEVTDILCDVLRGLHAAHSRGVVHRDIKPENVLLDEDGVAKLADFGTAHVLGDQSLSTHSGGLIVGTPWYMAPEMLLGNTPSVASDLWSIGAMAYEMLTGDVPFPQAELSALFIAVQNGMVPPLDRSVPHDVTHLLMRCFVKRPEDRASSAEALLRRLSRASATYHPSDFLEAPQAATTNAVFGRDDELADAQRWLDAAAGGRAAVLRVTGETGIGKSAFVDELRLRAQHRGFRWVACVASPTDGLLRSLVAALGEAYGDAIDDDDDADELRAVLCGDPGAPLRTGVERLLERLCARTGVIVCVDDAHHLSKAEASLLCRLVRRFDVSRLGLLFVGRDEGCDLGAASADLRDVRSLVLTGLSTEALYQHLEHYAGGARVPAEVVKRIARVTDGNPLFAEQVFEHLVAREALRLETGVYVPAPGWESTELPGRFRDAAARRVEGIDESDRELLEIAAVDGREFDGNALAAVSGRPLLQVLRSLQALCRGHAVLEPSDNGYRFRSGMLQMALYDELAPEMRRAIHEALAGHLESRADGVMPERLARHWESCGDLERAKPHLVAAARGAFGREDLTRFSDLARRAGMVSLDAGPLLASDRHLAVRLARTLREQACVEESELVLDALESQVGSDPDLATFAAIYRQIVPGFDRDAAELCIDALAEAAERTTDASARAEAYFVLGKHEKRAGNLDAAAAHLERAAESARAIDHQRLLSGVLDQMGSVSLRRGAFENAQRLYGEASALSAAIGRPGNAATSLVNAALAGVQMGDLDTAAVTFEGALRTFELEGIAHHAAQVRSILADTVYAMGETDRALECLELAIPVLQETRHVYGLQHAVYVKGRILAGRGELESAALLLESAHELAEHSGDHGTRADIIAEQALVDQFAGRDDAALAQARTALELRRSSNQSVAAVAVTLAIGVLFDLDWRLIEGVEEQILRGDSPLEEKAAAGSRTFVRAACAFARDPSATRPLLAGASALRQPVTASRARDAIVASWLEAEALRRDGSGPDAARVALDGARAARSLQHVWLEVALLALAETAEPTGVHAQRASSILGRVSASLRRDTDRSRLLSRWSFGGEDG